MGLRPLIAALLAFWLAFGPTASAWAQSAGEACESMSMSTPADDCCGDDMHQAKCLSACLAVSPAISAPTLQDEAPIAIAAAVPASFLRHASILAPPDVAPPKTFVS